MAEFPLGQVQVLVVLLPNQLFASTFGKEAGDGSSPREPASSCEIKKPQASGFGLEQSLLLWPFGEQTSGCKLSLSPSLILFILFISNKQIHLTKKNPTTINYAKLSFQKITRVF